MRLRRTAEVNQPLVLTGWVTRRTSRLLETEATLTLSDGTVIAEGSAVMFVLDNVDLLAAAAMVVPENNRGQ